MSTPSTNLSYHVVRFTDTRYRIANQKGKALIQIITISVTLVVVAVPEGNIISTFTFKSFVVDARRLRTTFGRHTRSRLCYQQNDERESLGARLRFM